MKENKKGVFLPNLRKTTFSNLEMASKNKKIITFAAPQLRFMNPY